MNKVKKSALSLGLVSGGLAAFAVPGLTSDLLTAWFFPSTQKQYVPIREDEKASAVRPHTQPHPPAQNAGGARFGDPLPGLNAAELNDFGAGLDEFTNREDIAGGLGPIFNDVSCVACHSSGGVGGASGINVTRFGSTVNGVYNPLENLGGSLLQRRAIAREVREVVPPQANVIAQRQTSALFGLGLIEAIPEATIMRLATLQSSGSASRALPPPPPANQPPSTQPPTNKPPTGQPPTGQPPTGQPPQGGTTPTKPPTTPTATPTPTPTATPTYTPDNSISGRVAMITDVVSGQKKIGRFGWKGQQATILGFSADAYVNEMGITNRFFPNENAPNGDHQRLAAFDTVKDIEDEADPSTGKADIDASADFMRFLAAPPRLPLTPAAEEGRKTFEAIQCATCHTPMLKTGPNTVSALSNKEVWLFSDLLLHDMGSLGDGIAQSAAGPNEFRTPPLWGLRVTAPYLHDGRAKSVDQAIRLHDGEAKAASGRYKQLTPQQRQQILEFLGKI